MATRTIYLIRHGEHDSENDPSDKLGSSLTPIGVEQAKLTAQRLRSLPIGAIYCSILRRAAETAEIIAREFPDAPLQRSRGLRECYPCVPPIPAYIEYFAQVPAEEIAQGKEQAEKAFDTYFKRARGKDKHDILISHGNLIRYFVCRVLGVQPETWGKMDICNCGISAVLIKSDGKRILVSHNDVGHLPRHLIISLTKE